MAGYREVFKRTEIKYLLECTQYEKLMDYLKTIARVDEYGLSRINNIYFDTPDFRLIRTSIEKPLYKEKLRLRTYGETGDGTNSFIEIKKKYDGIVYKRRVSGKYADTYRYLIGKQGTMDDSQISSEIKEFLRFYKGLRPVMCICYDRIAMAGTMDPDFRVTFDSNIFWNDSCRDLRTVKDGKSLLHPGQRLMEIKVCNAMPMELSRKLSELQIFPVSFSKYGSGYLDMMSSVRGISGAAQSVKEQESFQHGIEGGMAYVQ